MLNRPVQPGRVAQLGERGVRNAEVEGSIPFSSTTLHSIKYKLFDSPFLIINLS